jgi:DUF4097 and DUF4098 domain-containing protein YvlB
MFFPLMLIIIGVAILLSTTGVVHWSWWWLFSRYWPVVLILWGVVKFVEFLRARQQGYPPPRLGGGSIVFLVFFILIGITASGLARVNWSGIRNEIENDSDIDVNFPWFGSSYEFKSDLTQPMPSPALSEIKIMARRGDIKVAPSADGKAHVTVSKSIHGESQADADRLNQSTHAKFEQQGKIWVLDLSGDNFNRGRFDLEVELPASADLSVSTHIGNISVEQRPGNVNLSTDHGDINVEDIKGDASVHLKHGSVTASNVGGNVTLDGTVSNSDISKVGGTLTMTGTYWGNMQLAHIAKQVHFISSRTDLEFARLDGEFNMQPEELHVNGATGPFKLDTRSKSVHLEDVSGDVHIGNSNASVEISTKMPPGNIDVTTDKGGIDLTLPSKATFRLDAQSRGGEIESDFPVNVDNSGKTATAQGTVGKGGPQVRLKVDEGTIQLRKQE